MRALLRFFRRYLTPYLHWYAAGTVALLATNWLSVTIPLYLAEGIDSIAQGAAGRPVLLRTAWIVALMGFAVIVVRTASRLLFFTPGRLVEAQVKHDLFAALLAQQPAFLEQWPTGDLVSRASSDVNMIRLLAGFTALGVVNTAVAFVLTGTQMVRLSPVLAAWVIVPLVVGFAVTLVFIGRLRSIMQRMQEQAAALSDHILSSYQGIATVHAYRAEEALRERFDGLNRAYLRTTLERARLRIAIGPALSLSASVNVFLLLFIGGPMAMRGDLTVGELVAFTALVAYLTGPLRGLSFIVSLYKQAQASLERIDAVMLPTPDRPEQGAPRSPPDGPAAITIEGLSFAYPDTPDQPVLTDVAVHVPAGGTLGVFGPTGSGKTTLLRCLARLYNPPRGSVRVDDVDLLDVDLDAWRRHLAYVPQRAFLFSERVRDNIELGDADDERLASVLSRAALDVDMEALPDGPESIVGEAGLTLSGGQRQRVALARGLYRPHQLLVLDDVLSAVDHHTEQALIDTLRSDPNRPTTVIVAHRLSALRHASVIAVLDRGRVVDRGTHDELVERPGLYRDTWLRQREAEP